MADCRPGYILFIKKSKQVLYDDFLESGMDVKALKHPALVIAQVDDSRVVVCPLTSNHSHPLPSPPHSPRHRHYLPIFPLPPHPPHSIQLLTDGEPLLRTGYLNIGSVYMLHTDMLRAYDYKKPAHAFRLAGASFAAVVGMVGSRAGRSIRAAHPQPRLAAPLVPGRDEVLDGEARMRRWSQWLVSPRRGDLDLPGSEERGKWAWWWSARGRGGFGMGWHGFS
ncbi:hypothetical protein MMC30_001592 [Trapelia coarctata]|nr:hypothetical protein [Trapelia coarctata]